MTITKDYQGSVVAKELHQYQVTIVAPESEASILFIRGMLNRMTFSYHKYGPVKDVYPHKVDAILSLQQRLNSYQETGNTEFLIDAANFAMIEFMHPSVEGAFFEATDSDKSPGRTFNDGKISTKGNK